MVSRQCDNCNKVRRCQMIVTSVGIEYVCRPCLRELEGDDDAEDRDVLHEAC